MGKGVGVNVCVSMLFFTYAAAIEVYYFYARDPIIHHCYSGQLASLDCFIASERSMQRLSELNIQREEHPHHSFVHVHD